MPRRLAALLVIAAALLAIPATAGASAPATKLLIIQEGSPMARLMSINTVPLGWSSSGAQAVHAAEQSPTLRALHRRMHPLHVVPFVWRSHDPYWYVVFTYRGKIVADADVSRSGKLVTVWTGREALAPYAHGNVAWPLRSWLIYGPAALLFMLPFFDPRRLRRVAHLDALAVLAFLASYYLLVSGHLEPAVWAVYPPLIYLFARLLRIGLGRSRASGRLAPLMSTRMLMIGLPLLLIGRIALSLIGQQEIDVGYESIIGAFRLLHHVPIYWNDANHGDTYGPVTYLAYVPFELLFPWKNALSTPHGADAAALMFDLGTVGGLLLLGRRLRAGAEGKRLGLILGWAWAACPFTIFGLIVHTNDGLVSMLTVFALLAFSYPAVSGALLGLATAAKFSPAALLPLLAAPRQRGLRGGLVYVASFAVVVATAIAAWLPPGGFSYFWQRTIGFQMKRPDVFSPWSLHPTLHPVQTGLEVLVVLFAAALAWGPRRRSLIATCALAGAVTIAIQLPATHWYYYYIMWFLPFGLVGLLVRPAPAPEPALEPALTGARPVRPEEPEPVLASI